jgi:hypothetical protein
MQKYLNRIPVLYAVFFTAFISLGFVITLGAMQGDLKPEALGSIAWQSTIAVIKDLIAASVASGLIIGMDSFLFNSEKKNS